VRKGRGRERKKNLLEVASLVSFTLATAPSFALFASFAYISSPATLFTVQRYVELSPLFALAKHSA